MNPEDENYPKSPHKPSILAIASAELETTTPLSQPIIGSRYLSMEDMSFSSSPLSSSFPSPFMEFEPFSSTNPSLLTYPFEFEANPISEGAPLMVPSITTGGNRDTGGGGGGGDDVEEDEEENVGVPRSHPFVSLRGNPIPPFLSKTYDLVDDRTLDPIISWGHTGESFVVWDPVEFSRIILPRNFKHNNFSSFVRQLNTYGFRKIDADRWEFASEAFRQGERHLLKNIQRRKSPQSQQIGSHAEPSNEARKSGLENEVERLRTERSVMMKEVVELQQQQCGTVHHMKAVNQRLQAAEQRQKQMVSFLAKLFQNPSFLAHLKQKKEQGDIGSSRVKKKFIKHQQHAPGPSLEGQIVEYRPDGRNQTLSSVAQDTNPVPIEQSPNYALQGMAEMGIYGEDLPFQIGNVASDELAMANELEVEQTFIKSPGQVGEGSLSLASGDPHFKGKIVMSPQQEVDPTYFVSFRKDLTVEKSFPEVSSPGIESIVKQEDVWSMGFDISAAVSSSSNMLWDNLFNYDVPDLGSTGGFSHMWGIGSVQAAGGSGIDKWPADENPVDGSESHTDEPIDDKSKNIDP